jgi:type II secretory pathway pseudopilin PulG
MNEDTSKGRAWLMPALLGLVVGSAISGAPLGYHVMQLQTRLTAAIATAAQLQAENVQLQSAKSQLDADRRQLQAERDVMSLELQSQHAHAVELAKPDLPLQLSFRHALVASGLVLTIRNPSSTELPVVAQFTGSGARSQAFRLVIPSNGAKDVGGLEGWAFSPGDSVSLSNPNYRVLNQTVPSL